MSNTTWGLRPKPTTPTRGRRNWWRIPGSNRRPPGCKPGALPAELIPPTGSRRGVWLVGLGRFELPTPRLSSVCSDQLSYRPVFYPQATGPRVRNPGRRGNRFPQNRTGRVCLAATKSRRPAARRPRGAAAGRETRRSRIPDRSRVPEYRAAQCRRLREQL